MTVTIEDLFLGAPGSLLANHTPNTGGPWSIPAGRTPTLAGDAATPWLNNGSIYLPTLTPGDNIPQALAPGIIAGHVSILFTLEDRPDPAEQQDDLGAIARYQDSVDWYGLLYHPSNLDLELWKMTGAGPMILWTNNQFSQPSPPIVVQWEISGAVHWIRTSNGIEDTFEDTDDPLLDPGQVGIVGHGQGNASATAGTHLSQFLAIAGLLDPFPSP